MTQDDGLIEVRTLDSTRRVDPRSELGILATVAARLNAAGIEATMVGTRGEQPQVLVMTLDASFRVSVDWRGEIQLHNVVGRIGPVRDLIAQVDDVCRGVLS